MAAILVYLDFALKAVMSLNRVDFVFKMKLGIKFRTSFGPTAMGIAGFNLNIETSSGVGVDLQLGMGILCRFRRQSASCAGLF